MFWDLWECLGWSSEWSLVLWMKENGPGIKPYLMVTNTDQTSGIRTVHPVFVSVLIPTNHGIIWGKKTYVLASAPCDSGRTAVAPRWRLKPLRTDFKERSHLSSSSLSCTWHPRPSCRVLNATRQKGLRREGNDKCPSNQPSESWGSHAQSCSTKEKLGKIENINLFNHNENN